MSDAEAPRSRDGRCIYLVIVREPNGWSYRLELKMSHHQQESNRDGLDLDMGHAGRSRELLAIGKSRQPLLLALDTHLTCSPTAESVPMVDEKAARECST